LSLSTQALRIAVGGRALIDNLSVQFSAGQCWAILGRNGIGKTLLLQTLSRLREPQGGNVCLNERRLADYSRRELARSIGVLLQQESAEFWGSTADYVALGGYAAGTADLDQATQRALAQLELDRAANVPFRALSGGEQQRARLAQLLVQDAQIMLLDEPLNHLDLRHQVIVSALLRSLALAGRTIVSVMHDPDRALAQCTHALLVYDSSRFEHGPLLPIQTARALPDRHRLTNPLPAEVVADLYGLDRPLAGTTPDPDSR
jgi:iron complex transport system ATP-binding protein